MRARHALIPAAIPVLALTVGLPFVNRVQPVILGLPLLLFWTVAWVAATPGFLWLAYLIQRRAGPSTLRQAQDRPEQRRGATGSARSLRRRSGSPEHWSRGSGHAGDKR
jgi:hypothetical protein